jgi:hypothetical protein
MRCRSRAEWGKQLTLKLGLVLAFLAFSAFRTLAVTEAANRPESARPGQAERNLATLYGVTAATTGAIVAVAVALAHF